MIHAQAVLLHSAWAGARLMVGLAASALTTDAVLLALVAAGFALPAIVLALPTGAAMDRFGPRLLVLIGVVLAIAAFALIAFAPGVPALIASNALLGLGQLLCMIGQQGYVAHLAPDRSLDGAFGNLASAMAIGQVVGPIAATSVGTAIEGLGAASLVGGGLLFTAVCLVLALPLVWRMRARSTTGAVRHAAAPGPRAPVLVPGLWRALLVSGIVLASVDLMFVFLPAWARDAGVSAIAVGWLLSLRAAVTVVSRLGLDRLVRRFGRTVVLVTSLAAGVAGFLLLLSDALLLAILAMVVLGVALGIPQPLTLSWVMRMTDPSIRGRALGLRVTANRCIQLVMPLGIGAVAAPTGTSGMFVGSALALLGAAAVSAASRRQLDAERPDD